MNHRIVLRLIAIALVNLSVSSFLAINYGFASDTNYVIKARAEIFSDSSGFFDSGEMITLRMEVQESAFWAWSSNGLAARTFGNFPIIHIGITGDVSGQHPSPIPLALISFLDDTFSKDSIRFMQQEINVQSTFLELFCNEGRKCVFPSSETSSRLDAISFIKHFIESDLGHPSTALINGNLKLGQQGFAFIKVTSALIIPEPSSMCLLGLAMLFTCRRCR